MKLAMLFVLASLTTVVACEDKKPDTTSTTSAAMGDKGAGDNTKRNEVDRNANTVTPLDQGNNAADLEATQNIRKALMGDDSLSSNAKNAKVVTNAGVITLRGAVNSAAEKAALEGYAKKNAGANRVDNQLTIAAP